jgi:hypothetical protein
LAEWSLKVDTYLNAVVNAGFYPILGSNTAVNRD